MTIDEVPVELRDGRDEIECNFIFSLYKDPSLISSYGNVKTEEDIITPDGMFYYNLVRGLDKAGVNVFDEMSIMTFLAKYPDIKKHYEELGGYSSIRDIKNVVNEENIEYYYDELCKSNMLVRLHNKGYPVLPNLKKLKGATSEQVYDFFDYQLSTVAVDKVEHTQVVDMNDGYDSFISEWDKGSGVGLRVGSGMLNYTLAGLQEGLTLHGAHIGKGKTTSAILLYVLPAIEDGTNVVILSNEQTESVFRQTLLGAIAFNELHMTISGMNRQKIKRGNYTPEQKDALQKAADWLKEDGRGKVKFIPLKDYSVRSIKRIVGKYAKIGYPLFILDTLKPEVETGEAWAEFSEAAKNLFLIAHNNRIKMLCTCQLSGESMGRSYLDLSCTGKSKAIAETAEAVIFFRHIRREEYDKLKVFSWTKNEDGTKVKTDVVLDPNKGYIEIFLAKNRNGKTEPQLVCEFDEDFLRIKDVGYVYQPYDSGGRR